VLALLAVAALRVAHAASGGDCSQLAVVVPDGTANAAEFDWSTLPAVPPARCILIGPPDRGIPGDGIANPLKYAAVHRQIAMAQRQVGAAYGCGFWDWQGAMGGIGAALRWALAKPPLMQPDLTHMTAQGYEASGRAFARTHPFHISTH
jgi:hypothetical protein